MTPKGNVMTRRQMMSFLSALGLGAKSAQAAAPAVPTPVTRADGAIEPYRLSDEQWKQRLNSAQYRVLRREGTEPPRSSRLNDEKRAGTYHCAGCDLPLFSSQTKYESGTGWPSFHTPLPGAVATKTDYLMILPRTEYHCARCEGHQGHVFDDGPRPSGKRYCNNGVALRFEPVTS
jgi:peptide-methionine (R)-S-oxide reductase